MSRTQASLSTPSGFHSFLFSFVNRSFLLFFCFPFDSFRIVRCGAGVLGMSIPYVIFLATVAKWRRKQPGIRSITGSKEKKKPFISPQVEREESILTNSLTFPSGARPGKGSRKRRKAKENKSMEEKSVYLFLFAMNKYLYIFLEQLQIVYMSSSHTELSHHAALSTFISLFLVFSHSASSIVRICMYTRM